MTTSTKLMLIMTSVFCCTCGSATPARIAAEPDEERPASVELILSNLCGQDVEIADVSVESKQLTLHKKFQQKGLQFGQEAYLADKRMPAGTSLVLVKLELGFEGGDRETLEGSAELDLAAGPSIVEISIIAADGGCELEINTQSAGSSDEKCLEPPDKAPQPDPDC